MVECFREIIAVVLLHSALSGHKDWILCCMIYLLLYLLVLATVRLVLIDDLKEECDCEQTMLRVFKEQPSIQEQADILSNITV